MRVRCGRCGTEFDVMAPGRHACPVCGTVNQVGGAAPASPPGGPPPTPPPPPPLRVTCPSCEFTFAVGDIDVAVCPNCTAEVAVRRPGPGSAAVPDEPA